MYQHWTEKQRIKAALMELLAYSHNEIERHCSDLGYESSNLYELELIRRIKIRLNNAYYS